MFGASLFGDGGYYGGLTSTFGEAISPKPPPPRTATALGLCKPDRDHRLVVSSSSLSTESTLGFSPGAIKLANSCKRLFLHVYSCSSLEQRCVRNIVPRYVPSN